MRTPPTVEAARTRLQLLALETITTKQRETRRLSEADHFAIPRVLDELHRLHVAISRETRKNRATKRRRTNDPNSPRPVAPTKKKVTPQ